MKATKVNKRKNRMKNRRRKRFGERSPDGCILLRRCWKRGVGKRSRMFWSQWRISWMSLVFLPFIDEVNVNYYSATLRLRMDAGCHSCCRCCCCCCWCCLGIFDPITGHRRRPRHQWTKDAPSALVTNIERKRNYGSPEQLNGTKEQKNNTWQRTKEHL